MNEKHSDKEFATRAVWSGTQNIEGAAVTPIFNTATYQLTDERYAGWAAGAQHTALYSRLSSINSEGVAEFSRAALGAHRSPYMTPLTPGGQLCQKNYWVIQLLVCTMSGLYTF